MPAARARRRSSCQAGLSFTRSIGGSGASPNRFSANPTSDLMVSQRCGLSPTRAGLKRLRRSRKNGNLACACSGGQSRAEQKRRTEEARLRRRASVSSPSARMHAMRSAMVDGTMVAPGASETRVVMVGTLYQEYTGCP
jgi:hypothetical protein